jgi:hypothetical protein
MRCLILTNHSTVNEPLAKLTAHNKWVYGSHHGYDLLTIRMSWEDCKQTLLERILEQLSHYDAVMTVGSDVLFMNMRIRIEEMCSPQDNIVMAREELGNYDAGWSRINNDVMIWVSTDKTRAVIQRLIADREKWLVIPQLWQRYLQELIIGEKAEPEIVSAVRLVAPRVMNASNLEGERKTAQWHMGDWIFHAVCGDNEDKHFRLKHYLDMVSD